MSTHWDDIKNMAFEDRIAQMALAVLYSSNHIDVTLKVNLSGDDPEVRRQITSEFKTQKFNDWKKAFGTKPASADAVKLTTSEEGAVNKLVKEARDAEDVRRFQAVINAWLREAAEALEKPPYKEPDLGIIFRNYQDTIGSGSTVSEVNYDTVAVTIIANTIYLACNYKVRRMPSKLKLSGFSYSGFDHISANTRGLIVSALVRDFMDKSILGDEFGDRAKNLEFVAFVGLANDPTTEKESAAPHAEMQLVSFLVDQSLAVLKQYVGVNKVCCGRCYDTLHRVKMRCAEPRGKTFENWRPPGEIETKLVDKRNI